MIKDQVRSIVRKFVSLKTTDTQVKCARTRPTSHRVPAITPQCYSFPPRMTQIKPSGELVDVLEALANLDLHMR